MATGREMQLTRQIGEHLVAAELGRRGYVAAPFSGNVPLFDILAADIRGFAIPIQVKSIKGPSWQFSVDAFLNIEIVGNEQVIKGKRELINPNLLCIFVVLKEAARDDFYIFRLQDLQDHFLRVYKGGIRPRNPQSMHCAVWPSELSNFHNNWDLVKAAFDRTIDQQTSAAATAPLE